MASVSPEPPQGGSLVVFPERQDWWTKVSRVKTAPVGPAPVTIDGLPAGQYLVVALADVSARSLRVTPRLLAQLVPRAVRVETVEGHNTVLTVPPVRLR